MLGRDSGAVAVIFAIALPAILTLSGVGVDLGRIYVVNSRMQNALDATALYVAKHAQGFSSSTSVSERNALLIEGNKFFIANYKNQNIGNLDSTPKIGEAPLPIITISTSDQSVHVELDVSVRLTLLAAFGDMVSDFTLTAKAGQTPPFSLEVVMVLDITGSMSRKADASDSISKLDALKVAAKDLVNQLLVSEAGAHVKIGIVPYSQNVKLGHAVNYTSESNFLAKSEAQWLDVSASAKYHGVYMSQADVSGTNLFALWGKLVKGDNYWGWSGCVEARPGNPAWGEARLDELDTPPTAGVVNSYWVPYFQADEPDIKGSATSYFQHSYLGDFEDGYVGDTDMEARLRNFGKYAGQSVHSLNLLGKCWSWLPKVQPLTNEKNILISTINGLFAGGATIIPWGLVWGWRLISPGAPFTEGAPYTQDKNIKAIILMTDGANGAKALTALGSNYEVYGYKDHNRFQHANLEDKDMMNPKMIRICDNIKATPGNSIRLYTVGFGISLLSDINRELIEGLLKECASSEAHYYEAASSGALVEAFTQIANSLSKLRLVE